MEQTAPCFDCGQPSVATFQSLDGRQFRVCAACCHARIVEAVKAGIFVEEEVMGATAVYEPIGPKPPVAEFPMLSSN